MLVLLGWVFVPIYISSGVGRSQTIVFVTVCKNVLKLIVFRNLNFKISR